MSRLNGSLAVDDPASLVRRGLRRDPARRWDSPLTEYAQELASKVVT